jgi:hypothetical protein
MVHNIDLSHPSGARERRGIFRQLIAGFRMRRGLLKIPDDAAAAKGPVLAEPPNRHSHAGDRIASHTPAHRIAAHTPATESPVTPVTAVGFADPDHFATRLVLVWGCGEHTKTSTMNKNAVVAAGNRARSGRRSRILLQFGTL